MLPGEPSTPSFETGGVRRALIQDKLNVYKASALIGLEYMIELVNSDGRDAHYFCVLCNRSILTRVVFPHWCSYQHRLNYFERHYPNAMKAINLSLSIRTTFFKSETFIARLAQELEDGSGRLTPLSVPIETFRRNKHKLIQTVNNNYHLHDQTGSDLVDNVNKMLEDLKNVQTLNKAIKAHSAEETLVDEKDICITATNDTKPPGIERSECKKNSKNVKNIEEAHTVLDEISSEDECINDDNKCAQPPKKKKIRTEITQQPAYRMRANTANTLTTGSTTRHINKERSNNINTAPLITEKQEKSMFANDRKLRKLSTPKELSYKATQIAGRCKLQRYKFTLEMEVKYLKGLQLLYDSNPEQHPDYPVEWKKFWNRRYKELQIGKKCDPNIYDYRPEWISFWKVRMTELFNIAIDKKKQELKRKFNITEEDEKEIEGLEKEYEIPIASTESANKIKANNKNEATISASSTDITSNTVPVDIINISDDDSPHHHYSRRDSVRHKSSPRSSTSSKHSMSPRTFSSRRRSPSLPISLPPSSTSRQFCQRRYQRTTRPRSHDREHVRDCDRDQKRVHDRERERRYESSQSFPYSHYDYHSELDSYGTHSNIAYKNGNSYRLLNNRPCTEYIQSHRSITPQPITHNAFSTAKELMAEHEIVEGPLTIIGLLRTLSAFEENLGSLGPKALDLLGKALALEKVKPNASDELLLNEDNCLFLETIKEKLKGLIVTDVVDDPQKVRVFKKIITNIAIIVHQAHTPGTKTETINANYAADTGNSSNSFMKGDVSAELKYSFARHTINKRMATNLLKQGVENVTADKLNLLSQFFVLLVKLNQANIQRDGVPLNLEILLQALIRTLTYTTATSNLSDRGQQEENETLSHMITGLNNILFQADNIDKFDFDNISSGTVAPAGSDATNNGTLTDAEMQLLLKNFKQLSDEEQDHMISLLKKLEREEPERVENLHRYVDFADLMQDIGPCVDILMKYPYRNNNSNTINNNRNVLPGTSTAAAAAKTRAPAKVRNRGVTADRQSHGMSTMLSNDELESDMPENSRKFTDDEEDDYNFAEAIQNTLNKSKTVKASKLNERANSDNRMTPTGRPSSSSTLMQELTTHTSDTDAKILKDTEDLIANLMGTLQQNAKSNKSNSIAGNETNKQIMRSPQNVAHTQHLQTFHKQQQQQQSQIRIAEQAQMMQDDSGTGAGTGTKVSSGNMSYYSQNPHPTYVPTPIMNYQHQLQQYQYSPHSMPQQQYQQHSLHSMPQTQQSPATHFNPLFNFVDARPPINYGGYSTADASQQLQWNSNGNSQYYVLQPQLQHQQQSTAQQEQNHYMYKNNAL